MWEGRSKFVSKGKLHGLGIASGEGGADGGVLKGDAGGDAVGKAKGGELVASHCCAVLGGVVSG